VQALLLLLLLLLLPALAAAQFKITHSSGPLRRIRYNERCVGIPLLI
jgi:hypothetical protein